MANDKHEHPIVPWWTYVGIWVALVALFWLTVAVYELHLGVWANPIAMAIAITKAVLVILVFMGVKYSSRLTALFAVGGFIWLLILFGVLGDYVTRGWLAVTGWE